MSDPQSTVILHLTDLHFGWEGGPNQQTLQAQRTNCLKALHEALKKLVADPGNGNWKPDIVAITGDLGWRGAPADYSALKKWLGPVLKALNLKYSDVVVCPGNHDIDRESAEVIGTPQNHIDADKWLKYPVPKSYADTFSAYSAFCKAAKIPAYKLGNVPSHLVGTRELKGIRFIALNSAWYCRGEQDLAQLWVGRNHLQQLQADDLLPEAVNSELPVVAIVHHPPNWWHDADQITRDNRSCVQDLLAERSHIILTGHEHSHARRHDQINERAFLMKGGAAYAGDQYQNNVRLLRVNRDHVQYRLLEYNPRLTTDLWQLGQPSQELSLRPQSTAVQLSATPPAPTTSPAVSAYLARLTESTRFLELLGLGRSLTVELPIADAYVPLQASQSRQLYAARRDLGNRPAPASNDRCESLESTEFSATEHTPQIVLDQIFHVCKAADQRGVILLGEPGAGKTTGARQVAWQLASGRRAPAELGLPAGIRPVFLRLRNLKPTTISANATAVDALKQFLRQEVHCPGEPAGQQDPCDALWDDAGGLLWIIDGLDEVVDPQLRAIVSGWIQETLQHRLRDYFLVTCRFQGYRSEDVALGGRFVEFHVEGLSDDQVRDFINRWFMAANSKLHVSDRSKATAIATADAQTLVQILTTPAYQSRSMRELVTNPLLLTILCIVYHEERNLPTARAELYQHCVRVLLGLWRKELYSGRVPQGVLQPFDSEAAQSVLARLAWWLHQAEKRTAGDLQDLASEATQGLQQVSKQSGLGLDGRQFVGRMREESGILAFSGAGTGALGFLHLSFQEFLAADHAVRESLSAQLAPKVPDSWWQEVALLSLRRSKAYCGQFFTDMLACGLAEQHQDLAQRCLTESLYFVPDPFLNVLRSQESTVQRKHAVLRLLLGRQDQVPGLAELCSQFLASPDPGLHELRGIATELLASLVRLPKKGRTPEPFEVIVDGRTGVTLIWIPPGKFTMGAGKDNPHKPRQTVEIPKGFYLGKYPVTNEQYGRFLRDTAGNNRLPHFWDNRKLNQPQQPVVGVSWHDAVAYSEWAAGRLPTDAEWEYACRAGSDANYCFGDDDAQLQDYAWFYENSRGATQPVGGLLANAWGLHDMHGNVWEWCHDRSKEVIPESQWRGREFPDESRVMRGGGWYSISVDCSAWCRYHGAPQFQILGMGIRLARTFFPDP
jgi:formylglycine-generating enzyme required for sulfatase activity/3',5'-cyclic AMP phosphodiesterase CpdA